MRFGSVHLCRSRVAPPWVPSREGFPLADTGPPPARESPMGEARHTFCRICETLCGPEVTVEDNRILEIRPDSQHLATRGFGCVKGLEQHRLYGSPDRLRIPLERGGTGAGRPGSEWHRISWDGALAGIGEKVRILVDVAPAGARAIGPEGSPRGGRATSPRRSPSPPRSHRFGAGESWPRASESPSRSRPRRSRAPAPRQTAGVRWPHRWPRGSRSRPPS